jgi:glycosyltransferase involved in cell wall biosynthesis
VGHARHFDVLHAHSYHQLPALLAGLTAGRRPLVFTAHYHGTGHTPARAALHRLYRPCGRLLVRRADALVAVSEAEARLLTADFGGHTAYKVTVIPNGVCRRAASVPFDIPGRVVLVVGRLEPYKRVDLLLSAVPHLPEDVRLVVVGDGPARRMLAAQAAELGVAGRVTLTGRVSDEELGRWRATASAFASASMHEAFGLTLADALVSGLPAVVSAIPAHREVVALAGERLRCSLVESADPACYATCISTALRLGPAAASCQLPDWVEVAGRTLALYERLIAVPRFERRAGAPPATRAEAPAK